MRPRRQKGGRPKRRRITLAATPKLETELREIDDPDFNADHEDGKLGNRRKAMATVNVRESAIELLFARKLLDQCQKRAADHFRALWEKAGGTTAAIDYSAERIHGGGQDVIATRITAAQNLTRCRTLLGRRGYELVCRLAGEGQSLADISPVKRDRRTAADNLRADFDALAAMWGFRSRR